MEARVHDRRAWLTYLGSLHTMRWLRIQPTTSRLLIQPSYCTITLHSTQWPKIFTPKYISFSGCILLKFMHISHIKQLIILHNTRIYMLNYDDLVIYGEQIMNALQTTNTEQSWYLRSFSSKPSVKIPTSDEGKHTFNFVLFDRPSFLELFKAGLDWVI